MLHRIPKWFQRLFPSFVWSKPTEEKIIYLTFDDGPIPEITEWVLAVLEKNNAKASFFVVGQNVEKYPQILHKIIENGHAIGNHTYHHLKGWSTNTKKYVKDVERCTQKIKKYTGIEPRLFRPPHGRIKPSQAKQLKKTYELIMWNTLTVDYDKSLYREKCLQNSIQATSPGAIVVFHDSFKAEKNLRFVLPKYLAHFKLLGYTFKSL